MPGVGHIHGISKLGPVPECHQAMILIPIPCNIEAINNWVGLHHLLYQAVEHVTQPGLSQSVGVIVMVVHGKFLINDMLDVGKVIYYMVNDSHSLCL